MRFFAFAVTVFFAAPAFSQFCDCPDPCAPEPREPTGICAWAPVDPHNLPRGQGWAVIQRRPDPAEWRAEVQAAWHVRQIELERRQAELEWYRHTTAEAALCLGGLSLACRVICLALRRWKQGDDGALDTMPEVPER